MRQLGSITYAAIVCAGFALSGCMSIPDSQTPRFYMLQPLKQEEVKQKFDVTPNMIVAIGPVRIPEYQNRPQMVTQNREKRISFAQFDRWGESLDLSLARLLIEDLTLLLPGVSFEMFPCNFAIPLKYQVIIDVTKLDSQLDEDLVFAAQWSIIDIEFKKMVLTKRSEFRQPIQPRNYSGLAKTLSAACALLSNEIAGEISLLASHSEKPWPEASAGTAAQ
ncbi:MAG: PqiC family protein [Candidatus Omnitrophota bacterium]